MSYTTSSISFDLDEIYDSILEEKCVVVLGPNFYVDTEKGTHQKQLLDFLKTNIQYLDYYKENGFFLFDDLSQRTQTCRQIKKFYKGIQPTELLHHIAEIPFHFYMTVTPDKLLHQTNPQTIEEPCKDNPLIYNIFGILDNRESIILTHDDLYDYFKSIFARKSMPDEVRTTLNNADHIIFLGVPFQKWYMHLLLREFGAHENKEIIRYAFDQSVSDKISTLCLNEFKITFILNRNITYFVDELYNKFKREKGLREKSTTKNEETDPIKDLISKNKITEVLQAIKKHTVNTEFENEVIMLENRFTKYEEAESNNLLNPTELRVERAQIIKAITDLSDKIKNTH